MAFSVVMLANEIGGCRRQEPAAMHNVRASDRVGTIVCNHPAAARLFEELKIDFCTRGQLSLAEACDQQHLDLNATLAALHRLTSPMLAGGLTRPADLSLTELTHYIESTHHAYLHEQLPHLQRLASEVASRHGDRDSRLIKLRTVIDHLASELSSHLHQEEAVLFPWIRHLDAGDVAPQGVANDSAAGAMLQMDREHTEAAAQLNQLRALSDDFTCPAWGSSSYQELMAALQSFEVDLHLHVHKENNELFPRAIALQSMQRSAIKGLAGPARLQPPDP
jgi:regulator of cell morphogenesis and NO signaling